MSKEIEIKEFLTKYSLDNKIQLKLNEVKINQITKTVCSINAPVVSKDIIKIHLPTKVLIESIDWSDTDYIIDNIVDILNRKK